MFVDDVLIPIRYLVNNGTIVQEVVESVTYWHVQLGRHAVILAEGLACESYLDTGNRAAFANGKCKCLRRQRGSGPFDPSDFVAAGSAIFGRGRHRIPSTENSGLRANAGRKQLPGQADG